MTDDTETNWALTDYFAKVRLSQDGRILVATTYIGGVLEIFDINEGQISLSAIRHFYRPVYGYANGAKPKWVTSISETTIGFQDLFLSKESIYGLIYGVGKDEIENAKPYIVEFDFSGNPKRKFTSDDVIETFAMDSDGVIFGVGKNSIGEYSLNKYTVD